MAATTTLKLTEDLKAWIAPLAEAAGKTTHAWMVEALEAQAALAEMREAFIADAETGAAEADGGGPLYAARGRACVYRGASAGQGHAAAPGGEARVPQAVTIAGVDPVPRVFYRASALADLDRRFDFLAEHDPSIPADAAAVIADAVSVLARHPDVGRPARGEVRELVISHGRTGYVALCRVVSRRDRVEVPAMRHQREAGYCAWGTRARGRGHTRSCGAPIAAQERPRASRRAT